MTLCCILPTKCIYTHEHGPPRRVCRGQCAGVPTNLTSGHFHLNRGVGRSALFAGDATHAALLPGVPTHARARTHEAQHRLSLGAVTIFLAR
jgi:hypothetical protein